MQETTDIELNRASRIVEEGRNHASLRFESFPHLCRKLKSAQLLAEEGIPTGIRVLPPAPDRLNGRIEFDPAYILELTREHKHPEWVVCPRIERLVLIDAEQWESDVSEREQLVAHREKHRARAASKRSRDELH